MASVLEACLGEVDRVVVRTGRYLDDERPESEWPMVFLVDVIKVGADGYDVGLWDGETHEDAIAAARDISADWGIAPILDLTCGGAIL